MSGNAPIVDACGLICPLPVLKLRKFMQGISIGDTVILKATDSNTPKDMELFCQEMGYVLHGVEINADIFLMTVEKT